MSPTLSMAMLPIQRELLSGEYVPCWKTLGVPFGLRISYQRTPSTWLCLPPLTKTEWVTTSDSWEPLKLRYARRYINRSPRESSLSEVPLCGIQAPAACLAEGRYRNVSWSSKG